MLEMLEDISRRNGLCYFLAYGSALGAVRDSRQIPWDWDMDVLIPEPDYERLVAALNRDLPEDLMVSHTSTVDGYGPLFARISLTALDHSVVHLDLFPLVGATPHRRGQQVLYRVNHWLSRVHVLKTLRVSDRPAYGRRKRAVATFVRLAATPVPQSFVRAVYRWMNSRVPYETATWLNSPCGPYRQAEFFPADWFSSSVECYLSGVRTRVPVGVERLLTLQYGKEFRTPIPAAEQERARDFFNSFILPRIQAGLRS